MRIILSILFLVLLISVSLGQKTNVYFFPGQGSDKRLFSKIQLDTNKFNPVYFYYPTPRKNETMQTFAYQFIDSINQEQPFILIGTSMGGMICSELSDTLQALLIIVISSAKERNELPHRYRFQRILPIYKIVPKRFLLGGAKMMQPIVEPDRNKEKEVFKNMLADKNPTYMKHSIHLIVNWLKEGASPSIIHIHGDNDNTLPIKKIQADHILHGGSHMMTLTRGEEVLKVINQYLLSE